MKKIGILTSGGDAPGMNAVIRTVVRAGTAYGMDVMGIQRGYSGLIDDDMKFMDNASVEVQFLKLQDVKSSLRSRAEKRRLKI